MLSIIARYLESCALFCAIFLIILKILGCDDAPWPWVIAPLAILIALHVVEILLPFDDKDF